MVNISSLYQEECFLKKFDLLGHLYHQGEKDKGRLRDISVYTSQSRSEWKAGYEAGSCGLSRSLL